MGRNVGTVALAALAAFAATNVDDFLVLVVFFAQVDGKTFINYQVAAGQVLKFTVILAISLLGIVLGLFIPSGYIELLGFVPILLGLRQHLRACQATLLKKRCCYSELRAGPTEWRSRCNPSCYRWAVCDVANVCMYYCIL
jgi:cadmium resistance protein CadD (predicted permease)